MQYSFLVDKLFFELMLVQQYSGIVSLCNKYADLPLLTEIKFLHVMYYKVINLHFNVE